MLLSISGGSDLGLFEINEAAELVAEAAHPEANIIFGAVIDDALGDEVRVTVIAAGFDGGAPSAGRRPRLAPASSAGRAGRSPSAGDPAAARRASREHGEAPSVSPVARPVDRAREPSAAGRRSAPPPRTIAVDEPTTSTSRTS